MQILSDTLVCTRTCRKLDKRRDGSPGAAHPAFTLQNVLWFLHTC